MTSVRGVGHQAGAGVSRDCGGIVFVVEQPQMMEFATNPDPCPPLPRASVPVDATVSRRRPSMAGLVLHLRASDVRRAAQVRPPAIQPVAVDVIALDAVTVRQAEEFPVQQDRALASVTERMVPSGVPVCVQVPDPTVHPFGVFGINDGVSANGSIAGAQWDSDGRIVMHRESPTDSLGVTPPDVASIAGAFRCLDYTRLEGGRH